MYKIKIKNRDQVAEVVDCCSDNVHDKLRYTIAISSDSGSGVWRRWMSTEGYLRDGSWRIDSHVVVIFCLMAVSIVAFSSLVHVFISCLKSHLPFNHVVSRAGLFFTSFLFLDITANKRFKSPESETFWAPSWCHRENSTPWPHSIL